MWEKLIALTSAMTVIENETELRFLRDNYNSTSRTVILDILSPIPTKARSIAISTYIT